MSRVRIIATRCARGFVVPQMTGVSHWIGVAFRKGSMHRPYDMCVMATTMGEYVHAELMIGKSSTADVFSSYNDHQKGAGFERSRYDMIETSMWDVYVHPLADTSKAQARALELLAAELKYNFNDLWQCCVRAMLPFEQEVNCMQVDETWTRRGLFCSQMCLLFMRYLSATNDLKMQPWPSSIVEKVHSRGCSPNTLHGIVCRAFVKL